jgi:hypothetical protein
MKINIDNKIVNINNFYYCDFLLLLYIFHKLKVDLNYINITDTNNHDDKTKIINYENKNEIKCFCSSYSNNCKLKFNELVVLKYDAKTIVIEKEEFSDLLKNCQLFYLQPILFFKVENMNNDIFNKYIHDNFDQVNFKYSFRIYLQLILLWINFYLIIPFKKNEYRIYWMKKYFSDYFAIQYYKKDSENKINNNIKNHDEYKKYNHYQLLRNFVDNESSLIK